MAIENILVQVSKKKNESVVPPIRLTIQYLYFSISPILDPPHTPPLTSPSRQLENYFPGPSVPEAGHRLICQLF